MKRVFTLICFSFAAQAQTNPSESQTMQTLLSEVRQLRLALERSTLIGPRIQILVERLKLQQDHITRISRQLEDIHREMDQRRSDQQRMQQGMQRLDSQ